MIPVSRNSAKSHGEALLTLDPAGPSLGGAPLSFLSGSLHYWRHPPELWPRLLERMADLGFTLVCSYVPWSVHAPRPGPLDLTGSKDLARFCALASARGLPVILRPGPHINAEITGFGFPDWLLDHPEIQARGPDGHPVILPAPPAGFAAPSYAAEGFFDALAGYFDALAPVLAELLAPRGPVVALQADNENAFFFRTAPYDLDYHPQAIAGYRAFLRERYGDDAALRSAYGDGGLSLEELEPPRGYASGGPETLLRLSDWVRYKEGLARGSLLRVAAMLRERLPEDARPLVFHNYPPGDPLSAPFDVAGVEASKVIDVQGLDLYPTRAQAPQLRRQCRALLGQSRFPFIPELGAGASLWNALLTLEDQRFTAPYIVLHGVRGLNFYMAVERDRWYGAPILADGRVRPDQGAFFRPLLAALREIGFSSLQTPTDVVIILDKAYQYAGNALFLLSPLPPLIPFLGGQGAALGVSEERFGLEDAAPGLDAELACEAWTAAAARRGLAFCLADESWDGGPERRRLVMAPSLSFMSEALAAKLLRWRGEGSELLLGPGAPRRDERLRPAAPGSAVARLGDLIACGELRLTAFDGGGAEADAVDELLAPFAPGWMEGLAGLEGSWKHGPDGREVLMLARPGPEAWRGPAPGLARLGLRRVWGEGELAEGGLAMPGWSVTIWAVGRGAS